MLLLNGCEMKHISSSFFTWKEKLITLKLREGEDELVEVMPVHVWGHIGGCDKHTKLSFEYKELEGIQQLYKKFRKSYSVYQRSNELLKKCYPISGQQLFVPLILTVELSILVFVKLYLDHPVDIKIDRYIDIVSMPVLLRGKCVCILYKLHSHVG